MKKFTLICLAAMSVACTQTPSIDTSPEAELTFDGLAPISNSRFKSAWIDPDVDLAGYDKIMAGGAEFEFRAVKKSTRSSTMRRSGENEFWISDENKQKLVETVSGVFVEELQKSEHFEIVDEAGPDVLIIVGVLHDIVSRVPPEMIGRGEIYLASVGEATLIIELRDSLSGETIYRAIDRRAAERADSSTLVRSNSVNSWSEVRRMARRWATRLTQGLDSIHQPQ